MAYTAVTLATLQSQLGDRWEDVPFWTDEEARLALNEALRVWNLLTGQWKRRVTQTTTANTVWYTLPSMIIANARVEFNGRPLEQTSLTELDNGRPNWENEKTNSGGSVPTRPALWAPAGLTLMAIWPADAAGSNSLVIDGVRATPTLARTDDYIDIGQEELNAILGYALHAVSLKAGGSIFRATLPHYKTFITAAADKNDRLRASNMYRWAMGLDVNRVQRPERAREAA